MPDNTQEQSQDTNKVSKAFEANLKKLTAIVGGTSGLKPVRQIKKDAMQIMVEELFKEEQDGLISTVKNDLKALLKNYVSLNALVSAEKKKLEALHLSKQKEFNEAAVKLFNQIENIDSINADYLAALNVAEVAVIDNNQTSKKSE